MNTDRKPAELKLVNGTDTIVIRPKVAGALDPILCKQWDLGAPELRFTTVANPGSDGTTESDGYLGQRTVTMEVVVMGGKDPVTGAVHDAYWYASKLTQMQHPRATPVLQITRDDELNAGKTWNMALRGGGYTAPFTSRSAALLEMSLTFVCPGGLIDGPLLSFTTPTSGAGGNTDLDFPTSLPFTFGLTGSTFPQLNLNVGGDATVIPTVYISGPVKNPEVRSGDDKFVFDGLTLIAGQTVQIDMASGAIRLGSGGQITDDMNAYNTVDWAKSSFWAWQPGFHNVRFYSTTGSVTVQYRERRLTI